MAEDFENFLEHYGVKGMKWGKRKREDPAIEALLSGLTDDERAMYDLAIKQGATPIVDRDGSLRLQLPDGTQYERLRKAMKDTGHIVYHVVTSDDKSWYEATAKKERLVNRPKSEVSDSLKSMLVSQKMMTPSGRPRGKNDATFKTPPRASNAEESASVEKYVKDIMARSSDTSDKPLFNPTADVRKADDILKKRRGITHSDVPLDNFLEHYGVLGMKWGRRKDRKRQRSSVFFHTDPLTGKTSSLSYDSGKVTIRKLSNGSIEVKGKRKKDVIKTLTDLKKFMNDESASAQKVAGKVELSNDELSARINRLRLEQDYARLTAKPAAKTNPFTDFAIRTGSQILSQAVTNVGSEYLKQALKVQINKKVAPEFKLNLKGDKKD